MRRTTVALLLAVPLLAGVFATPPAAQAPPSGLRVLSREGTRTLSTVTANNQELVALDDVAQAFGLTLREDQLAGGVTLSAGSRSIIITPDQPVVSVAGRLVSLTAAPVKQGPRWLLPLDFLSRAVGLVLETRFDLRRPSRLLIVGDLRVPRIVSRVEATPGGVSVTFDVTPATPARVVVEPGRLVAVFEGDALDITMPAVPPQDFLQAVQPGETPTSVRLITGPKFGMHRATTTQPDPGSARLVVELLPSTTDAPPPTSGPPGAPAPPTPTDLPPSPLPIPAPGVRTIVIDAGHGGDDIGARSADGTQEKDVTLSVARRLRTMIEGGLGLRVFLTRDDDRTMTLDERSAYANSQKADAFLSIHANAAIRPGVKGAEVYYLSLDPAEADAGRLSQSSGTTLPVLGGGTRTIDLIPWDAAQARYLDHSATLAGMVEQGLRARIEMSPRALQQAPFRVLVGANMPAVLTEIGYLSNAEQARALATPAYQDRVAQALFDAVAQFRASFERAPAPAAAPGPGPR